MFMHYPNRIAIAFFVLSACLPVHATIIPDLDLSAIASRIIGILAKEAQSEIENGLKEVEMEVRNDLSVNRIASDENIAANNISRQTGAMYETANTDRLKESRPAPNACQIYSASKALANSKNNVVVGVLNNGDRNPDQLRSKFVLAAAEAHSSGDREAINSLVAERQRQKSSSDVDLVVQVKSGNLDFLNPGVGVADVWDSSENIENAFRFGTLLVPDTQDVNMFAGTASGAAERHILVAQLSTRARFNLERTIVRKLQGLAQYQSSITVLSWMDEQITRLPDNMKLLSTAEVTTSSSDLYRQRLLALVGELGIAYQALNMARLEEVLSAVKLVSAFNRQERERSKWQI